MESFGMVGRGLDSMDQVFPKLEPDRGNFSVLDISQEEIEFCEAFADICGDCLDSMHILEYFLGLI